MVVLILESLHDIHQVDICLFNVVVERIDLLESVDRLQMEVVRLRDAEFLLPEVDVSDSGVGLETTLVFANPKATFHFKFVVCEEHPSELRDELKSMADVVNILVTKEVAKVESRVSHLNDLKALVNGTKVNVCQVVVNSEKFESVHAGARATGSGLDSKQIPKELGHEVRVKDFAIECPDHEREDRNLWQTVVSHQNEVGN